MIFSEIEETERGSIFVELLRPTENIDPGLSLDGEIIIIIMNIYVVCAVESSAQISTNRRYYLEDYYFI